MARQAAADRRIAVRLPADTIERGILVPVLVDAVFLQTLERKVSSFQIKEVMAMDAFVIWLVIVVIIGFAGVIGNQYSMLRRMEKLQQTLEELKDNLKG
jgi:hypothetical protein